MVIVALTVLLGMRGAFARESLLELIFLYEEKEVEWSEWSGVVWKQTQNEDVKQIS